ncbi:hypothetical protein AWL63_01135 [Sphingomonas panacis]|uniref:Toxin n=1 Tax=Sphingomonas panacis TaxID=1560345 RepID=A0A1B3Z5T6_9SPHN|nr:type II toxin-antitoxin system RelE/ParE family toxin [Sphingomonas panacis]AOH82791.1 hypothetical protein AWL63_01135 [Sphingomonas panacis]
MRLELSRKAKADLDDIRDYSVQRFGEARAILYLDPIEQAFRRILQFPESGASRSDLSTELRSISVGRHRLYYRVYAERVRIVRILHHAMEIERHL